MFLHTFTNRKAVFRPSGVIKGILSLNDALLYPGYSSIWGGAKPWGSRREWEHWSNKTGVGVSASMLSAAGKARRRAVYKCWREFQIRG